MVKLLNMSTLYLSVLFMITVLTWNTAKTAESRDEDAEHHNKKPSLSLTNDDIPERRKAHRKKWNRRAKSRVKEQKSEQRGEEDRDTFPFELTEKEKQKLTRDEKKIYKIMLLMTPNQRERAYFEFSERMINASRAGRLGDLEVLTEGEKKGMSALERALYDELLMMNPYKRMELYNKLRRGEERARERYNQNGSTELSDKEKSNMTETGKRSA